MAFLTRKWNRELDYRLIKELWAFTDNRIAVRFAYEYHDDFGNWFRAYGNENWEFDENGLMQKRFACINDLPIKESERKFSLGPLRTTSSRSSRPVRPRTDKTAYPASFWANAPGTRTSSLASDGFSTRRMKTIKPISTKIPPST